MEGERRGEGKEREKKKKRKKVIRESEVRFRNSARAENSSPRSPFDVQDRCPKRAGENDFQTALVGMVTLAMDIVDMDISS